VRGHKRWGTPSLLHIAKGGRQRGKVDVRKEIKKGNQKKKKKKESIYTTKQTFVGTLMSGNSVLSRL